jgi:mRNA-degrading endonuclease RelE of RelBE toxin-antitoxin system
VIRVFLSRKCVRSLASLTPQQREKAEAVLRDVSDTFGQPHRHAGTGLRNLFGDYYECRIELALRIVLLHRHDSLLAYDVMTHDQLRAFLRNA